ncbi:MAG: UvrB/UvrC motif-containing protein [Phycisphaeraceae bacterium]|nr:UvrB/UvrC motif-containing protein [Phycisphaeraceae bacterium]
MKCDKCASEATVHEVRIQGGKKVERHLCEKCAREEGFAVQSHVTVPELLGQLIAEQAAAAKSEIGVPTAPIDPTKIQCPTCGTTYGQFRHSGLLGCAVCYEAFEAPLSPLLQRAQEGGTHHTGKVPKRLGGQRAAPPAPAKAPAAASGLEERLRRLETLKKQLNAAVAAEQYEQAASLRDQIRRIESPAQESKG